MQNLSTPAGEQESIHANKGEQQAALNHLSDQSSEQREDTQPAQEDSNKIYYYELPLAIRHVTGYDPDKLPESRLQMMVAVESCFLAERLFWIVTQLGMMVEHGGWRYSESRLSEALESLGLLGQAAAEEACDRVQALERLAMRYEEGKIT